MLHSIFVKMIVCSTIFVLCNYLFRDTWFLCLKIMKTLFSKKKIWSQRMSRFVFCCSSLFDWWFNSFLTQTWDFFLSFSSRVKSIWKITCHLIYSFRRFLFCIEMIKTRWFFLQLTHFRFSIDVLQMFSLWELAQIAQRRLYLHDLFICW